MTSSSGTSVNDTAGEETSSAGTVGGSEETGTQASSDGEIASSGNMGEPVAPGSCADVLASNPGASSGRYEIAPSSATRDVPFEVYCDMVTDGGGWTLVGRSAPGNFENTGFGWSHGRGSLDALEEPYSLDLATAGLEFDAVLLGERADGFAWGAHVYRLELPPAFVATYPDQSIATSSIATIIGDCEPSGGPDMLELAGYTQAEGVFFFRDTEGFREFGLLEDGFDTYFRLIRGCSGGADLDGTQGMLFVR